MSNCTLNVIRDFLKQITVLVAVSTMQRLFFSPHVFFPYSAPWEFMIARNQVVARVREAGALRFVMNVHHEKLYFVDHRFRSTLAIACRNKQTPQFDQPLFCNRSTVQKL
jgi:hypothetical protein